MHLDSAPKAPQLFRTERDRSVTHQYGVVRCPIRCQPSGSPFEGYEAGSGLSFLWLAFREGHFPSRSFVSSLISVFALSHSYYLFLSLFLFPSYNQLRLPSSISCSFFFFLLLIYQRFQSDEPFCSWSPRVFSFAESFKCDLDRQRATGKSSYLRSKSIISSEVKHIIRIKPA